MIDERLNASGTSKEVDGAEISGRSVQSKDQAVTAQVIPLDSTSNYTVYFEGAVLGRTGHKEWGVIASFEDDREDQKGPSWIPISLGCLYRFRHAEGTTPVQVRMTK